MGPTLAQPPRGGLVTWALAAFCVITLVAPAAGAQELREIRGDLPEETDLLEEILAGEEAAVGESLATRAQGRWLRLQGFWRRDDRLAAGSAAADLLAFLREEGIQHAPALADGAFAEGVREEKAGRYSQAIEAYRLARALDADLASAAWRESRLTFEMGGDKGHALGLAIEALQARWAQPWSASAEFLRFIRYALLALAITGAAFVVVLLVRRGGAAAAGLGSVLPHGWNLAWRKLLGWTLLLAPLGVIVFGAWTLLVWPVLLTPALRAGERRLVMAWLVLLVVLAPLSQGLASLEAIPVDEHAQTLIDTSRGTLRSDVVPALVSALRESPNESLHRVLLANALDKDFPDRAIQLLRQASRLAPRDPRIRIAIGNVLFRVGKKEAAGVAYREAIQIEPTNVLALLNLAKVELAAFSFEEAENLRRRARSADEDAVMAIEQTLAEDEVGDPEFPLSEARALVRSREAGPRLKSALLAFPPFSLAALAALLASWAARLRVPRSRYAACESCGVVYDGLAVGPDIPGETCTACHQLLTRMEGLAPDAREKQSRRIDLHLTLRGQGRALVQLLWPGLALVHEERFLLGLLESSLFVLFGLLALASQWPLAGGDVAPLWTPGRLSLGLLVIVWMASQLPGLRPRSVRRAGRR